MSIILDPRDNSKLYQQALALAKHYCPDWADYWPAELDVNADPGLVLFKLFASLTAYTIAQLNKIPQQRQLDFYRFMSIPLRLPTPAHTLLTFVPVADASTVLIPATTEVAHVDEPKLVFHTSQDMQLLPVDINTALLINPEQDEFVDSSGELNRQFKQNPGNIQLFGPSAMAQPLQHWLLLGDTALFDGHQMQSLTLKIRGKYLAADYFILWYAGNGQYLNTEIIADPAGHHVTVNFKDLPMTAECMLPQVMTSLLNGIEPFKDITDETTQNYYWLAVRPFGIKILPRKIDLLPHIYELSVEQAAQDIPLDFAAYNDIQVSAKNGCYPFGQTPSEEDAFYMSASDIFSKVGAEIRLDFAIKPIKQQLNVNLSWEFWDGSQWQIFNDAGENAKRYQFVDASANFTKMTTTSPYIKFICPVILPTEVAGVTSYWIRVRIAAGGYGSQWGFTAIGVQAAIDAIPDNILQADLKPGVISYLNDDEAINFGYKINDASYYPPFILSIKLQYIYTRTPQVAFTHNNFVTNPFSGVPYEPVNFAAPTFFLGLAAKDFAANLPGYPLNLFFAIDPSYEAEHTAAMNWEYYNGEQWLVLDVVDGTNSLNRAGLVTFTVPLDAKESSLFAKELFWLRLVDEQRAVTAAPKLLGIYPNTVAAVNCNGVNDEMLGSGNNEPNQTFCLAHTPVIQGLVIEVIEPELPYAMDDPLVQAATANQAQDQPLIVRWEEVVNFAFSTATSRHYTLDYATGKITFGNGVHGMAVPSGTDNVIARRYYYSDAGKGNAKAGEISVLQSGIGEVAQVFNTIPCTGGSNGDTLASIIQRGPYLINNRDLAVTQQNFAWLAVNADPQVVRASVTTEHQQQRITIAILVKDTQVKPMPSQALLEQVREYVAKRALCNLAARIQVTGPRYHTVDLVVQLTLNARMPLSTAKSQLTTVIAEFFNPLVGGNDGQGWQFGQPVLASELSVMLLNQPAVNTVWSIKFSGNNGDRINLASDELPCLGSLQINLIEAQHGI